MLSRPGPSEDGYIADYFEYFDGSQIGNLDFVYKGGIGGAVTAARAQFKGPVKIRDFMVDAKIKAGNVTVGTHDPTKMTEIEKQLFEHRWTVVTDGKMPSWLDFPFNRKTRTVREASEGPPRREKEWYIDDEHNVVYFIGGWD